MSTSTNAAAAQNTNERESGTHRTSTPHASIDIEALWELQEDLYFLADAARLREIQPDAAHGPEKDDGLSFAVARMAKRLGTIIERGGAA